MDWITKKKHSRYIIATITESHNLHGYHSRWNIFISDILTMFTIQLWGCQVFEICALLMNNMKHFFVSLFVLFLFLWRNSKWRRNYTSDISRSHIISIPFNLFFLILQFEKWLFWIMSIWWNCIHCVHFN